MIGLHLAVWGRVWLAVERGYYWEIEHLNLGFDLEYWKDPWAYLFKLLMSIFSFVCYDVKQRCYLFCVDVTKIDTKQTTGSIACDNKRWVGVEMLSTTVDWD